MITRTWPYGTTRRATVLDRETATKGGGTVEVLVVLDDAGEAHILVGTKSLGQPGDVGTITFLQGGPSGGYWQFQREEPS